MPLKFCANLSFMFQETASLLDRYKLAKQLGFKAVECASPYDFPLEDVVAAKESNKLEQILINVKTGNMKEEVGFAALPGKREQFMSSFNESLRYAKSLNCKIIHIMSGIVPNRTEENQQVFLSNLRNIIPQLESNGILGVIEPINAYSVPNYYLNNYDEALDVIKSMNSRNLRLQLDIFHLQQIKGNLSRNIKSYLPYTGHIQIAQVPDRNEPDSDGELNYAYILKLLENEGYSGWIGLEYKQLNSDVNWIQRLGYSL